jgi:hypothetical protein
MKPARRKTSKKRRKLSAAQRAKRAAARTVARREARAASRAALFWARLLSIQAGGIRPRLFKSNSTYQ